MALLRVKSVDVHAVLWDCSAAVAPNSAGAACVRVCVALCVWAAALQLHQLLHQQHWSWEWSQQLYREILKWTRAQLQHWRAFVFWPAFSGATDTGPLYSALRQRWRWYEIVCERADVESVKEGQTQLWRPEERSSGVCSVLRAVLYSRMCAQLTLTPWGRPRHLASVLLYSEIESVPLRESRTSPILRMQISFTHTAQFLSPKYPPLRQLFEHEEEEGSLL